MRSARVSPWTLVPALFMGVRALQVLLHWLIPTPYGVRLASGSPGALPRALLLAGTEALLVLVLFRLLAHAAPRLSRAVLVLYAVFASVELVYGQADLEILRWLGQHVDLGWFRAYGWKPDALKARLFRSDALATTLAFLLAFVPPAFLVALAARREPERLRMLSTGFVAIPALLGLKLSLPLMASRAELSPVQPPLVTAGEELLRRSGRRPNAEELASGIAALHEVLNRPASDFPLDAYPLWHPLPQKDEEAGFARVRALPGDSKRDLVLVLLESPQGWEFDLTRAEARKTFPSLASLLAERGVFFPHAHSVGFPSPEGRVGVHLGLFSDPMERVIEQALPIRTLALPQILARAGWQTTLVTAGDPTFDKMPPWYDRWYQSWEYDAARSDDLSAARHVIDVLNDRRSGEPRFLLFNTVTMHAPLTFPGAPDDPKEPFHHRYMDAARFADAALGRLFDGLRKSGRWARTVVIVVGDHSWPGPWIGLQAPRAGVPNVGETWVPLLVAAPELPGGTVREEPVSQLDVPPTVLGLLGVTASTHFVGRDLLAAGSPAPLGILSFRNRGIGFTRGPYRFQLDMDPSGFLKKTRYVDWDPGCPDPEPYGCYRNGTPLPITLADAPVLVKLREAARAYAELWESNRFVPPEAMVPYRR